MISEVMTNLSLANAQADVAQGMQEVKDTLNSLPQKIHDTIAGITVHAAATTNADNKRIHAGSQSSDVDTGTMWNSFGDQLVNIFNGIRPFVIGLVVVALIVEAIGCIIGGEQSRQRFKQALPWIIGAAILIMMALTVAQGIVNGGRNDFAKGDYNSEYYKKYSSNPM